MEAPASARISDSNRSSAAEKELTEPASGWGFAVDDAWGLMKTEEPGSSTGVASFTDGLMMSSSDRPVT